MPTVEYDDEDIRAIYTICDYALKYSGLNSYTAIGRILSKMPEIKPEKEEKR
jgi:hypothetical protein